MAGIHGPLAGAGDRVSLRLAPTADNVAVARHAVADLVARSGASDETRSSAEVVVTEAFTNAARHAYPHGDGDEIEVSAQTEGDRVEIAVRDHGVGIRPRPAGPGGGRMGLLLIAAIADCVRLRRLPEGGTEVHASVSAASASRALGGSRARACCS